MLLCPQNRGAKLQWDWILHLSQWGNCSDIECHFTDYTFTKNNLGCDKTHHCREVISLYKKVSYLCWGTDIGLGGYFLCFVNVWVILITFSSASRDGIEPERYKLKWCCPLSEVELKESSLSSSMQSSIRGEPGKITVVFAKPGVYC